MRSEHLPAVIVGRLPELRRSHEDRGSTRTRLLVFRVDGSALEALTHGSLRCDGYSSALLNRLSGFADFHAILQREPFPLEKIFASAMAFGVLHDELPAFHKDEIRDILRNFDISARR